MLTNESMHIVQPTIVLIVAYAHRGRKKVRVHHRDKIHKKEKEKKETVVLTLNFDIFIHPSCHLH